MDKVLNIYDKTIDMRTGKRTKTLWNLGIIISKNNPIITNSFYMQSKYPTLSSDESIKKYLSSKFYKLVNQIKKRCNEHIERSEAKEECTLEQSELERKRILHDATIEIEEAKKKMEYLEEILNKLKVVITGIEAQKPYPTIYYNIAGGSSKIEYLRIDDFPNIVLAHRNFYQTSKRRDAKVFEFVQDENTIKDFNFIYVVIKGYYRSHLRRMYYLRNL